MRKVYKEKDAEGNVIVPAILDNAKINEEWEKIANQILKPLGSMAISKKVIHELKKYYLGKVHIAKVIVLKK